MQKIILLSCCFLLQQIFGNAQVNWQNVSTNGMGYVDGLFINPTSNTKYVRTDVGGIFKFNDAAQRWVNITDNQISLNQSGISGVESFAFDKNTSGASQVIYALCGNGVNSYIMKSVNDGNSWTINQGWNSTAIKVFGNGDWRCSGEKLAVDPNNSNVVYTGTRFDGLYKTTDAAQQWNKVTSFTETGGNGGLGTKGGLTFVVFDPSSTTTVNNQTVTKNIYVGLIDRGVYRSNDGGNTWAYLDNGFDTAVYNPVRATFNNNRLIVATMKDAEQYGGEIWQFTPDANSTTGTWVNKTPGLQNNYDCPVYGRYPFNAVAVKPGTANTVYLAIRGNTPRKIFYTENFDAAFPNWKILTMDGSGGYGGACAAQYQPANFTTPASWVNTSGYDWVGDIAFDAVNNNKLWLTSGNGVMKVEDITASPALITSTGSMKDLEILCVNAMVSPPAPNTIPLITASMDVFGIRYTDLNSGAAVKLDNSFGLEAAVSLGYSFKNPNTLVAVGQDYNNPVGINRVIKSTDGGVNWQSIYNTPPTCTDAAWGGNIAISATNTNNIVWVPSSLSYRGAACASPVKNFPRFSTNGGASWQFCNNINFADGNFPFLQNSVFAIGKSLESDKVNGNKFYYYAMPGYTFNTQLWRTTDAGANWILMSAGAMPITGSGQLKANPYTEDDIWFAPFNNYIRDNDPNPQLRKLFHSTDGGTTWATLTATDEVYAFGFGMKPNNGNNAQLIVYGKRNNVESIYLSNDLGNTFTDLGTLNIPKGIIGNIEGDMKVPGRIYAATGCRGIWYGDASIALPINISVFTGNRNNAVNYLKWEVENVSDVSKFIIEYSSNGADFIPLNEVNVTVNKNYAYQHATNNAVTYYRIKLVYQNGQTKLSNTIKLQEQTSKGSYLYPNPSADVVTININDKKLMGTQATVFAMNGSLMEQFAINNNFITIDVSKYAKGVYSVRLTNGETLKLIKQ
jgi:xyloglucan-specific exo-beta-1,4-glucanase